MGSKTFGLGCQLEIAYWGWEVFRVGDGHNVKVWVSNLRAGKWLIIFFCFWLIIKKLVTMSSLVQVQISHHSGMAQSSWSGSWATTWPTTRTPRGATTGSSSATRASPTWGSTSTGTSTTRGSASGRKGSLLLYTFCTFQWITVLQVQCMKSTF